MENFIKKSGINLSNLMHYGFIRAAFTFSLLFFTACDKKSSEVTSFDNKLYSSVNITAVSEVNKSTGIEIVSCMGTGTNPLNNLCFRLKNSGKYLVDFVILFSANIRYNQETGRVYVHKNNEVRHLLDNREKYLKPLQDRGIKVILGILGDHDRSGLDNLSDETARQFAQELEIMCDIYQLDGVFFDNEYTAYQYPPPLGFVYPSSQAASLLCYETKKAIAVRSNRLVMVYAYSSMYSLPAVDGKPSGTFVDYALHDYGRDSDLSNSYPGMLRTTMGLYSQEFARNYYASGEELQSLRNNSYGTHMIFDMDPNRSNFNRQKQAMDLIALELFDDELEIYGSDGVKMSDDTIDQSKFYQKDYASN